MSEDVPRVLVVELHEPSFVVPARSRVEIHYKGDIPPLPAIVEGTATVYSLDTGEATGTFGVRLRLSEEPRRP